MSFVKPFDNFIAIVPATSKIIVTSNNNQYTILESPSLLPYRDSSILLIVLMKYI